MSRPADAPAELRPGLHLTDKVGFPDLPITARLVDRTFKHLVGGD